MATQKPVRILYQAKNNAAGLTDVKAQVYLNGAPKAVGVSAIVLSEVDATNSPGLYELVISGATLTGWGAAAGSYNCLEGYIDSATKSAKAAFRQELTVASIDDVDAKLGAPAGASVSADIAAIKAELDTAASDAAAAKVAAVAAKADLEDATNGLPAIKSVVSAVKSDVEDPTNGLAAIKTAIGALSTQVGSIQNNTNFEAFVPAMLVKPSSGSTTYRVPITVQNEAGAVADPDSDAITVTLLNVGGVDRSSMLVGASGGSVQATRDSAGVYHVDLAVASGSTEEELIFGFAYAVGGVSFAKRRVGEVTNNVQADGLAQQSTLLDVQTKAGDIQTRVTDVQSKIEDSVIGLANIESLVAAAKADLEDGTFGLAAIQTLLASGSYGLAALKALLVDGTYGLAALQAMLANGTYGLSAIQALVNSNASGISSLQTMAGDMKGSGFVSSTDSLRAISQYLAAYAYAGGQAI